MKKSAFTFVAFLAMASVAFAYVPPTDGDVTLSLVEDTNTSTVGTAYILSATGVGITTLSEFTITTSVHQVWTTSDEQTPYIKDGVTTADVNDSYVLFGDFRVPDLAGMTGAPGGLPAAVTAETNDKSTGSYSGWGLLDNSSLGNWDSYVVTGEPGATPETVPLMRLVLSDSDAITNPYSLDLTVTIYTATDYNPGTGESTIEAHTLGLCPPPPPPGDANCDYVVDLIDLGRVADNWGTGDTWAEGDFNGDLTVDIIDLGRVADNWGMDWRMTAVPEPGTILMLVLGSLCLVGYRLRKRAVT